MNAAHSQGFTLIELSIVLVIIGLIIGGVLVGQDLIHAAAIRSAISQIEKYNTAVNTFNVKFGALPGDIPAAQTAAVGLTARSGAPGHGDGDSIIEGGVSPSTAFAGESQLFWADLSAVHLIEGNYLGNDSDPFDINPPLSYTTTPTFSNVMPKFKFGGGNFIHVYGFSGTNYYHVFHLNSCAQVNTGSVGGFSCASEAALSPIDALELDSKIDDGMPLSGRVMAAYAYSAGAEYTNWFYLGAPPAATPASPAGGVCVSNAPGNPYNVNQATGGSTLSCSLRFAFQ